MQEIMAVSLAGFALLLGVWALVMVVEPRSLWSGVTFFNMMLGFGVLMLLIAAANRDWLDAHRWAFLILLILAAVAGLFVVAFPLLLFVLFLVQGIRILRHEGLSPSNMLSLLFAVLWFSFLVIWPIVGLQQTTSLGAALYIIVSFSAVYMLALMAMYALSALLNLFHLRKSRRFDYIVVLGSGLNGSQLTPLLASRVNRGIALLERNPQAKLILSGGQGPGEDLPEGEAMAAYAIGRGVDPSRVLAERQSKTTAENLWYSRALMTGTAARPLPRVAIVTTAYHVFRALVIAKKQGLRCVGFGSKTKWYFTLNAVLREFAGYMKLTRKRHVRILAGFAILVLLIYALTLL